MKAIISLLTVCAVVFLMGVGALYAVSAGVLVGSSVSEPVYQFEPYTGLDATDNDKLLYFVGQRAVTEPVDIQQAIDSGGLEIAQGSFEVDSDCDEWIQYCLHNTVRGNELQPARSNLQ